ncbi:hypothetical protein [Couchioplanes azureus]|uniref:hypothetical protein n=1 Tax=Couchioplanes caeruleus TaxID=56438 RepID=UPI0016708489|nr:hypothetical protein [Couchioplanes caeruleus]GGQ68445.1 hypothetical protein GCM10010166_43120 [Couchioplanes caeruleus subsp. azureus]
MDELIRLFRQCHRFEELLAAGYGDLSSSPERVVLYGKQIFIGAPGPGYLDLSVTQVGQWIQIGHAAEPTVHPELAEEDQLRGVLVDMTGLYLSSRRALECKSVTLYIDDEFPTTGRVRGLSFSLDDGTSLVVDPANVDGISLGDERDLWRIADVGDVRAVEIPVG